MSMLGWANYAFPIGIFAAGAAPAGAQAPSGSQTESPYEILVLGTKRVQSQSRLDGSISVRSAEQLQEAGVETVSELENVFPGLLLRSRGNRAYANITARGISSPDYYSPSVVVYVDGVPQQPSAIAQPLLDVRQVEFLRGPQGTLYGRNAFAGVLNVLTQKPTHDTARAQATLSETGGELTVAGTETLAKGALYLDGALTASRYDGQIRDAATARHIDGSNDIMGRLALRYAPTGSDFDTTLSISHERLRSHEEMFIEDRKLTERRYAGPIPLLRRHVTSVAAIANWRVGRATLSTITSYQDADIPTREVSWGNFPEQNRHFAQEFRVAYDGGDLRGVGGATLDADWFERTDRLGALPYYGPSRNRIDTVSLGLYGDLTYRLSGRLDVSGGLRLSYDRSKINFQRPVLGTYYDFSFRNEAHFTEVQPKVAIGYQADERTRIYGVISKGYKPGGFNHAITTSIESDPYKPENAWNYEIGFRNNSPGDRFTTALSLYHIRTTGKQLYTGSFHGQVLRNAGKATSSGVELEAMWRPSTQLSLTATGNLGRSRFTDFTDPFSKTVYNGKRIPYAPDLSGRIGAKYVVRNVMGTDLALLGSARFTGRTWFNEANSLGQSGGVTIDAAMEIGIAKGLVATVFADNLSNRIVRTASFDFGGGDIRSTISVPRSIGVSLRARL